MCARKVDRAGELMLQVSLINRDASVVSGVGVGEMREGSPDASAITCELGTYYCMPDPVGVVGSPFVKIKST